MGDSYTEEIREPLTFSAAPPGWRAVYVDDDPDHTGGFLVVPLVGWSVFHSYLNPGQPDPEPGTDPGREKPDGRRRGPGRGRGRLQPPVFDPHPAGGNP